MQKVLPGSHLVDTDIPWKFSFELKTKQRIFQLYAPTQEERDLWVNGIHRILGVPVDDPDWVPMSVTTQNDLDKAEDITINEGNNRPNSRQKLNNSKLDSIEEIKR